MTNVSVVGNNLSVAKVDGSTSTVTVPYAQSSTNIVSTDIQNFLYIKDLRDRLESELRTMNVGDIRYLFGIFNLSEVMVYWGNNWDYIMTPYGRVLITISKTVSGDTLYGVVHMVSYENKIIQITIKNNIWSQPEYLMFTVNGKNVADAWKLSSNNQLVIDANNTSTDQIVIGNTADNYTGSGFKYLFKNGKGNYADVYVNNIYGNVKGTADRTQGLQSEYLGLSNRPQTANIPTLNDSSVRYFLSTASMKEGKPESDGAILQFSWDNKAYDTQLFIPNDSKGHLQVRRQDNSSDWSTSSQWNSVAWLNEVVTLTGTSTVTGTLNVPTQVATDNSDKVASTAFVQAAIAAALKAKGL